MSDPLRSQIYVLTALLKDVQKRRPDGIPMGQDLTKGHGTSQSTAGKTFQHLATILTRGTEDPKDRIVAVTGGPLNENPLRIYLTTRSPSAPPTISPSTSNETNNNDDEPVPPENDGLPDGRCSFGAPRAPCHGCVGGGYEDAASCLTLGTRSGH
ncbi:hypothetical protein BDZ89DRAFT_300255 [Hymenopellis radicata]|nr:hypothetical protein BDZ89DRAFT_300255 [Hymenopellis radicata]